MLRILKHFFCNSDLHRQIFPFSINAIHQIHFPQALIAFHLLFPFNSIFDIRKSFEIHQFIYAILTRKPIVSMNLMLYYTTNQIVCNPYIEYRIIV